MTEMPAEPRFATDDATATYYDRRAAEYDQWYLGTGQFAARARPGWADDRNALCATLMALRPTKTLDVACGTGFLTAHLAGLVVGLDQSRGMVSIAAARIPSGVFLTGDALALPFADHSFERLFTAHFYGHLGNAERTQFLREARRVADEVVVVDSASRPDVPADGWQQRALNDGSRHRVYKRYFSATGLAAELSGTEIYAGRYFVAARASLRPGDSAI